MKKLIKFIKYWVPAVIALSFVHAVSTFLCDEAVQAMRNTGDIVLARDTYSASVVPFIITGSAFILAIVLYESYIKEN